MYRPKKASASSKFDLWRRDENASGEPEAKTLHKLAISARTLSAANIESFITCVTSSVVIRLSISAVERRMILTAPCNFRVRECVGNPHQEGYICRSDVSTHRYTVVFWSDRVLNRPTRSLLLNTA